MTRAIVYPLVAPVKQIYKSLAKKRRFLRNKMPSAGGSTGKSMAGSEFLLVGGDFAPR
jgi:hypothetical protein